jgi:hypothetical protein
MILVKLKSRITILHNLQIMTQYLIDHDVTMTMRLVASIGMNKSNTFLDAFENGKKKIEDVNPEDFKDNISYYVNKMIVTSDVGFLIWLNKYINYWSHHGSLTMTMLDVFENWLDYIEIRFENENVSLFSNEGNFLMMMLNIKFHHHSSKFVIPWNRILNKFPGMYKWIQIQNELKNKNAKHVDFDALSENVDIQQINFFDKNAISGRNKNVLLESDLSKEKILKICTLKYMFNVILVHNDFRETSMLTKIGKLWDKGISVANYFLDSLIEKKVDMNQLLSEAMTTLSVFMVEAILSKNSKLKIPNSTIEEDPYYDNILLCVASYGTNSEMNKIYPELEWVLKLKSNPISRNAIPTLDDYNWGVDQIFFHYNNGYEIHREWASRCPIMVIQKLLDKDESCLGMVLEIKGDRKITAMNTGSCIEIVELEDHKEGGEKVVDFSEKFRDADNLTFDLEYSFEKQVTIPKTVTHSKSRVAVGQKIIELYNPKPKDSFQYLFTTDEDFDDDSTVVNAYWSIIHWHFCIPKENGNKYRELMFNDGHIEYKS